MTARDPRLPIRGRAGQDQKARPLLDAYVEALGGTALPFTVPGHKRRAGRLDPLLGRATDVDVPLFGGLDTMKLAHGRLDRAEALAADLWGADWCRFGVGGASQANQALLLALGRPGQQIVMSRSIHRSVMSGLVLTGFNPIWLPVSIDPTTTLPLGPTPERVREVLAETVDVAAVWVTEPSYLGTVADIRGLAGAAHDYGVPLVVDQAWAAHFGFHPAFPSHALAGGADAMVISAHKALPSYSQASILLARTERLDADRLTTAFDATNTTSPAGAILASTDGARQLLATRGATLLGRLVHDVEEARRRLRAECPGLVVPAAEDFPQGRFDPAKLVIGLAGTGADGVSVEGDLERSGISLEMADLDTLVATVTIIDSAASLEALTDAVLASIGERGGTPRPARPRLSFSVEPQQELTPREAFFASSATVPAGDAVGRVSAELVAVYPPGIPVLAPGERVTADLLEALRSERAAGSRVAYAADPTLATLRVVT